MRICKVYDGDYPWDIRVEKITNALIECGHEVHLVCRNLKGRPLYEVHDKVYIHRLPYVSNGVVNYSLSFPAFCNPLWISRILRVVRNHSVDAIIVRDLPLALAAITVGRIRRVPVVFDMAEDYPAMIAHVWRFERFKHPAKLFLRNPLLARIVERVCVRNADRIVTVVEESKARLIKQYGYPASKIHVVCNTPMLSALKLGGSGRRSTHCGSTVKLIYIGGLQPVRNLDVILKGIALCRGRIECSLTILGRGGNEASLKRLARHLNIEENIHFMGWVDQDGISRFLADCDVGLVPHAATAHTNTTVPNKLFDYMAFAKPVLASDTKPVERIIRASCCGLVYRHDDPPDFVEKLMQLVEPDVRALLGGNGRRAVEGRYNWSVDSRCLMQAVERSVHATSA